MRDSVFEEDFHEWVEMPESDIKSEELFINPLEEVYGEKDKES